MNITPRMIAIVLIDAWSNWRITSAAISQAMPMASQIHHSFDTARAASRTSGPPGVAGTAAAIGFLLRVRPRCSWTDPRSLPRRARASGGGRRVRRGRWRWCGDRRARHGIGRVVALEPVDGVVRLGLGALDLVVVLAAGLLVDEVAGLV